MRILQVAESYGATGGLERFIHDFSEKIVVRGWDTIIGTLKVGDHGHWGNSHCEVVQMGASATSWIPFANSYNPDVVVWHLGETTAKVVDQLAHLYPTVSTVHGVMCPSGARLFRDRDEPCSMRSGTGCLHRWYARQCGTSKSPYKAVGALLRHKTVLSASRRCTRVYAVSQSVRTYLEIEGVSREKIRVFDNTLGSVESITPIDGVSNPIPVRLLFVGRLVYEKGVQYLLQAVACLSKMGVAVECKIVGDGWYRKELEHLAETLGIMTAVQFEGNVPGYSIGSWYDNAHIVVVPSIWPDPAPLVVPEARRHGKPVVVTDIGGLPEWADLMDSVYVAKHANAKSLADVIISLTTGTEKVKTTPEYAMDVYEERVDILEDISQISLWIPIM